jgi:hypothetical protein
VFDKFVVCVAGGLSRAQQQQPSTPPVVFFTQEPLDVVATRKDHVLFNCSLAAVVEGLAVNISWWKDGQRLESDGRVQVLADGALLLRRLRHNVARGRSDEGLYSCHATTPIGTVVSRAASLQIAG